MKQGLITRPGVDANGNDITRKFIHSKLLSIGTSVLELNNDNKTQYRVGTIEAITAQGELKTFSTQIWEKNAARVKVGEEYLTEVRVDNGVVYLNTTSMNVAERASVEDFAFGEKESVTAKPVAEGADLV